MLIRAVTPADFQAIAGLIDTPEEQFLVFPAGTFPFTVKQVQRLWETREDLTALTVDDQVAGFANLYERSPGKHAFIGNLVIERRRRGQGLGQMLVRHMLDRIYLHHDLPVARISVFAQNQPALLLYNRNGFQPYAAEERKDPMGQPVTLLHLQRYRQE